MPLTRHVGLLEIYKDNFRFKVLPLIEDVVLSQHELDASKPEQVMQFLVKKVDGMIQRAAEEFPAESENVPSKPLVRLRVEYSGYPTCNPQRFGQRFVGRVANPNDILLFHRRRATTNAGERSGVARAAQRKHIHAHSSIFLRHVALHLSQGKADSRRCGIAHRAF